jgi:hypothetical protein
MRKSGVILSIVSGAIMLLAAAILFYSCSGSSGGGGNTSSGKVALYATDDMSDHKQVIATINKVTVMNTSTGATCDVLTTPTTIDIANLANVLQLLNVVDCPAVPYNRIHIEFSKSVELMNLSGAQSPCSFSSYKDDFGHFNALQCTGGNCSLDVNGAVNILANQYNKVALDFNLKDFDVINFGTQSCSVTMKVSPLHGAECENLGYHEAITGLVSDLTTSTHTFDLTKDHMTFNVLYSGITSTQQPDLDALLLRAQQDGLRTLVTASTIDYTNKTIDASKILVKAEGLISTLTASTQTFTLSYKTGKTINIDFSNAVVKGSIANNVWAEVKLYGFNSTSSDFLAAIVEVEYEATWPDDHNREMGCEN